MENTISGISSDFGPLLISLFSSGQIETFPAKKASFPAKI